MDIPPLSHRHHSTLFPHDVDQEGAHPPVITVGLIAVMMLLFVVDPYLSYRSPLDTNPAPPVTEAERQEEDHLRMFAQGYFEADRLAQRMKEDGLHVPDDLTIESAQKRIRVIAAKRKLFEDSQPLHPYTLHRGQGIKPWQWITSKLLNGSIGALLLNIYTLWMMGLIVEGKLGWWRFLLLFLGLAIVTSGIEQALTWDQAKLPHRDFVGAAPVAIALIGVAQFLAPLQSIRYALAPATERSIYLDDEPAMLIFDLPLLVIPLLISYGLLLCFEELESSFWTALPVLTWFLLGILTGVLLTRLRIVDPLEENLLSLLPLTFLQR